MNDQELNEAVARKLGWEPAEKEELANDIDPMQGYVKMTPGWKRNGTPQWWPNLPAYSTSIAAAWDIVEHIKKLEKAITLKTHYSKDYWFCELLWSCPEDGCTELQVIEFADTAPRAICEAFLKLKEKP